MVLLPGNNFWMPSKWGLAGRTIGSPWRLTFLGQNNAGFNPTPAQGLSFVSKEAGAGQAVLSVDFQSTPCPITILAQPQSGFYYAGATVDLAIQAGGGPVITYQWQHAGTNLPGATASTLRLNNLQATHAGDYQVLMTNPAGTTNSAVATVTLLSAPVISNGFEQSVGLAQPLGYWRMNETAMVKQDFATNSGSLGAGGDGKFLGLQSHPVPGALAGRSDTAASFWAGAFPWTTTPI